MRVGINPNRKLEADHFEPVVFGVVTHLPNFEEYHERRFEVLQTSLRSMVRNADIEHTLMIWDNDSHPTVREWIMDEMKPDIFVSSFNFGKTGSRTSLMRMLPPYLVVAFGDDDIYYYPGWFKPQLEILEHFPNVACVTGYPVRTSFRWGNAGTKRWARQNAKVETGRFLPQQWEDDFAVSIGRDVQKHRDGSVNDMDVRINYKGVQAYATSHHCQFIAKSEQVARILTYDGFAMGDERPFDEAMDSIGLRLATMNRYTRHIGNVLHDELKQEIEFAELHTA
jgi:hypothetical protein